MHVAALAAAPRYPAAVPRWAAAATRAVLGVSGLLEAVAGQGSAMDPLLAISVAVPGPVAGRVVTVMGQSGPLSRPWRTTRRHFRIRGCARPSSRWAGWRCGG